MLPNVGTVGTVFLVVVIASFIVCFITLPMLMIANHQRKVQTEKVREFCRSRGWEFQTDLPPAQMKDFMGDHFLQEA